MEKSCPVPARETVCGLPDALSATVSVPVRLPVVVGSKKTPMEQLEPAATVLPQALSTPKSDGVVVTLVTESEAVPVLVRVTVCGRPEVPTYWLGKLTLEATTWRREQEVWNRRGLRSVGYPVRYR
jgi:hypothetical protein